MTEAVTRPAAALPNTSADERVTPKSAARKLYEIFTPRERVQAGLLFLGSLLTALVQAVGVGAIFPFINVAMNPQAIQQNEWLAVIYRRGGFAGTNEFIIFLGLAVLATIVASSIAPAIILWAKTRFVLNKNHALSTRLLTVYLSKTYQYFLGKNTSELGKNVLTEVSQLTMTLLMAIFEALIQGILLIVLTAMLLAINVRMTLGAILLLGGGYAFLSLAIKRRLQQKGTARLSANENRFRFATEALGGIKTAKVMGVEQYFIDNYAAHSFAFAQHQIFANIAGELPRYILEGLAFGGIIVFLVVNLATGGSINDLLPLIGLFAFAAYRIMPALYRLYFAVTQIHFFTAVLDKIHTDMLEEDATNLPPEESIPGLPFNRAIRLEGIDFRYADAENDVIRGLDIEIPKNASIGLVGTTGSGKTTLVDIILGLLVPQGGKMLVDDTPVNEENIRAWRHKIGYVPQDIYLSDDSIRKNIAFGVPDDRIDDDQIVEASRIAALHDFIQTLPQKYDTIIGERGVRLSGGQRQRIGLARALYRNPEVLVLDEATSSLDGATEEAVLGAFRNASKSRTVIMIAHRLNTLKDCDSIYVMENGRFTASGTYDDLLLENKTFIHMARTSKSKRSLLHTGDKE